MISDMHVHTLFSSDSNTLVETQIEQAIQLGMKCIAITDHQDYDYPPWHSIYLLSDCDDTLGYIKKLQDVKTRYADRIEVIIGIELGLQVHLAEKLHNYTAEFPFEFVIGSTHCFEGRDTEDQTLYACRSEEESCRAYFRAELDNITAVDSFDVVGHLDFVLRDLPNKNRNFTYQKYADILDQILLSVIQRGKGLECNTKTLSIGWKEPSPNTDTLRRYRELGGEIITFGSDGHTSDRVGGKFELAAQLVRSCGFKYYCVYRNRKPVFLPL